MAKIHSSVPAWRSLLLPDCRAMMLAITGSISTPKHFAVHSGPESTRHFTDVDVSKHDELDTYLPAFRAAVVEGHAGSVMCAYNAINGQPACASEFLLQQTLRGAWNFQGYVVSDCDAVRNIFRDHHYRPTQPQASAISLIRGMDNECIDFAKVTDDHDYRPVHRRGSTRLSAGGHGRHRARPPVHGAHSSWHVRSA